MNRLRGACEALLGHFRNQERADDHASEGSCETEYDERQSLAPFIEPTLESLPRDPTSEKKDSDAAQQRDLVNWTRRLFKATGALATATFAVAAFSGWQAWEMRKGSVDTARLANAANRSANLSEATARAWIAPIRFALVNIADANDPLKVRVTYQNVGREPAKNVKNWIAAGFVPLEPVLSPEKWTDLPSWYTAPEVQPRTICSHVTAMKNSSVIYPSSSVAMSVDTSKYSVDKEIAIRLGVDQNLQLPIEDIKGSKAIYFVVGCFVYESLGTARHSAFCAYANPSGGGSIDTWQFSACPVGNDDW